MHEVRVTHEFNFNIEKVFAGVSDHVEFLSTSKILCGMKRVGNFNPNGLGALREVRNGMLCFEEEITAFDPPHAYEYRILSLRGPFGLKLPFQHKHGRVELQVIEERVQVIWTSRFRFSVPLLGAGLDRKFGATAGETFLFFLKRLDTRLQEASGRA